MITKRVGHVIRLQVGLTVLAALVAAGMAQDAMHAGLSALLGGAIVVMGALVYIGVAFARKRAAPGVLVRRHFRAEALKMIVTAFLLVAVMLFFKSVSAGALLGGFAAAQSAYWLGLLSK